MGAHKIVLSTTLKKEGLNNTTIISNNPADKIKELKSSSVGGSDEILLFGSPTATHSLLQLNLIDGFWLFLNPIILGRGIPLFTDIKDKINLKLLSTQPFSSGVTELNYTIER
jgi:dihydrofolate reductase